MVRFTVVKQLFDGSYGVVDNAQGIVIDAYLSEFEAIAHAERALISYTEFWDQEPTDEEVFEAMCHDAKRLGREDEVGPF